MANDIQKTQSDLQTKLDDTLLPQEVIEEISIKEQTKTLRGVILETFGLGAVEKVFDTAERIADATDEYKKGLLMQSYIGQVENAQAEILKLQTFIMNPEGNILFSKVTRLLSENPLNPYYSQLLAHYLKKTVQSDFQKLFTENIYALNQIEKLTPQGLILLADYESWPEYKIMNYSSQRGVVTSEWIEEFLMYYTQVKGITEDGMARRIANTLRELLRNGFIRSKLKNETDSKTLSSIKASTENPAICEPTELGKEILEYIE
ncbi:MAG: hypothetical protein AAB553_05840 [Patescibacteria group bacterium]